MRRAFLRKDKAREQFDAELVEALKESDVGLVVLAGFMRIFSGVFTAAYPNLILNIHPALLPSFPGFTFSSRRWITA